MATAPSDPRPDVQLTCKPYSCTFENERKLRVHAFPGMQIGGDQMRPASRGSISLQSNDPAADPRIEVNYLAADEDQRCMVRSLQLIRKIAATAPLAILLVLEQQPGAQVQTEEQMLDFVRRTGHPINASVGNCRMGQDDLAVVDNACG